MRWYRLTVAVLVISGCAGEVAVTPSNSPTQTPIDSVGPTPAPSASASPSASPSSVPSVSPTPSPTATLTLPPPPTQTIAPPTPTTLPTPTSTPAPAGWTEVSAFPKYGPRTRIDSIAYGNGTFVAVGWSVPRNGDAQSRVWTSANGSSWTAQGDADHGLHVVTFSGSAFYAFAADPTSLWRSNDGKAWQRVNLPESNGELGAFNVFSGGGVRDATAAGGVIYAAGSAGIVGGDIACDCAAAWRSSNGSDWQQSTVSPPYDYSQLESFSSIAVGSAAAPFAVAPGDRSYLGDAVMYTTDFDTWNEAQHGLDEWGHLYWGFLDAASGEDGQVVAVGWLGDFSEAMAMTTDGTSWSTHSIATGAVAEQVVAIPGGYLVVGSKWPDGRFVAPTWVSADGATWKAGPRVYSRLRDAPSNNDDVFPQYPFSQRAVGSGTPGVVVAQTFDDGLHVWFAPLSALGL